MFTQVQHAYQIICKIKVKTRQGALTFCGKVNGISLPSNEANGLPMDTSSCGAAILLFLLSNPLLPASTPTVFEAEATAVVVAAVKPTHMSFVF